MRPRACPRRHPPNWSFAPVLALTLLLPACAGGGGGGAPNANRTPQTVLFASEDGRSLLAASEDGTADRVVATSFTGVHSIAVSPDGRCAAFRGDREVAARTDLYVVELATDTVTMVGAGVVGTAGVTDMRWAPDSLSLAYRVDETTGRPSLFRGDRDGSGGYPIHRPGANDDRVRGDYQWSADGRFIAFASEPVVAAAGRTKALRSHIAATRTEGSNIITEVASTSARSIPQFAFSPDSTKIAYRGDLAQGVGQFEIWRRASDGQDAGSVRSNGTTGSSVQIGDFAWSKDGAWLSEVVLGFPNGGTVIGLNVYAVGTDSSRRVVTVTNVAGVAWSPAGNLLAAVVNRDVGAGTATANLHLMVHDADGNATHDVSGAMPADESVLAAGFEWAGDGGHLTWRTLSNSGSRFYVAPSASGAQRVPIALATDNRAAAVAWSPDGQRFGLLEHDDTQAFHPGEWHLYDPAGTDLWRSGQFFTFETSQLMRWTTDSERAVFAVNATSSGGPDLLRSVRRDGSGEKSVSPRVSAPTEAFVIARGAP